MLRDRDKWNDKYRSQSYGSKPSAILKTYHSLAPKGIALDIAAGNGRNSLFLAEQGFHVDAVDISDVGLSGFTGRHPSVRCVCADLDVFDIPADRYSLILNIRFLNRRLFPYIREGLVPGGVLIFETYLDPPKGKGDKSFCRDYILRPNELLHAFISMRIVNYSEALSQDDDEPRRAASLVAMKERLL